LPPALALAASARASAAAKSAASCPGAASKEHQGIFQSAEVKALHALASHAETCGTFFFPGSVVAQGDNWGGAGDASADGGAGGGGDERGGGAAEASEWVPLCAHLGACLPLELPLLAQSLSHRATIVGATALAQPNASSLNLRAGAGAGSSTGEEEGSGQHQQRLQLLAAVPALALDAMDVVKKCMESEARERDRCVTKVAHERLQQLLTRTIAPALFCCCCYCCCCDASIVSDNLQPSHQSPRQ
jgi:hypothetical protein